MIIDNVTLLNLLYDSYGELLTKKQREIFELYYFNDLSLGEIAEHYGITRQGVHDIIRRSQVILNQYEKKLGIVRKFTNIESRVEKVLEDIKKLEHHEISTEQKQMLRKIYKDISMIPKEDGE
jgi:predicted DNA-binding protein YlxM (UPF0122 family)